MIAPIGFDETEEQYIARLEAEIARQAASQGSAGGEREPVAWIVLSDETGNTRIWWRDKARCDEWCAKHNATATPLYDHPAQASGDCGAWQSIETAPRDGTPIEACNTRHQSHAPVIVRWTENGLSAALPEPHWCDAATADGSALYYNHNYFDFWKPTTALPSAERS